MINQGFVNLGLLSAVVASIACASPAQVAAQSLAEDERRLVEFTEHLSRDARPMAQLVGMLLMREESAQDSAAEKLAQRSDLPDGALALIALKVCLQHEYLALPAFCSTKPFAEALWATDHSNEFNLSIACRFSRNPRESTDEYVPHTPEEPCLTHERATRYEDYSQDLKSFLIPALDKHHVLDKANLSPFSELPVMQKVSPSLLYAELFVHQVYRNVNRHMICDAQTMSLSAPCLLYTSPSPRD